MYQRQLAKVRWSILTSNCSSTSSCHGISWKAPWQFERTSWWHFRFMFRCPIYVPTLGVSTYRWHMLWRQTAGGPSPGSWKPSTVSGRLLLGRHGRGCGGCRWSWSLRRREIRGSFSVFVMIFCQSVSMRFRVAELWAKYGAKWNSCDCKAPWGLS